MKVPRNIILIGSCTLLLACSGNKKAQKETLQVFCAAGLTDMITEWNKQYTETHPLTIRLNLASSGTLARQMEQGNKADVFISASKAWADYADSLKLFSRYEALCRNKLVFITPQDSPLDTVDFQSSRPPLFTGYLSVGDPAHVPAGNYAREALMNLGWWGQLLHRILPAKDVRSAVIPVELGECELGIVYYSVALSSKKLRIIGIVPENLYTPIVFYALLASDASVSARNYYDGLFDCGQNDLWNRHGLTSLNCP